MLGIRNFNPKCVYDYTVSDENVVEIKKLKAGERASIVSDTMFRTMFQNEKRIKYSARLLSCILDISYEELLKNISFYKNNSNKENNSDKNQRCDYVAKIDNSYINIEMNNNSSLETMERNIQYLNGFYSKDIKEGEEYKYDQVIQINLNNFSFKELEEEVSICCIQDHNNLLLTKNIIFIQIYIPNIRKKWYTLGKEGLNELERCILALTEPDIDVAKDISLGDCIMEDYVDESIEVCKEKTFGESYDKEWALKDEWKKVGLQQGRIEGLEQGIQQGIHQGIQQGIEQGSKDKQLEIAKNMLSKEISLDTIIECTGLSKEEIKNLK